MRVGDDEADVHGDGADVGDVIVDALQFQQDRAHDLRAKGNFDLRRFLDCLAERRAVGEGRIARHALGQKTACGMGTCSKTFSVPLCV